MDNRVLQFEVWNECNNGCIFCSNKYVYDISDEEKLRNLEIVMKKISDDSIYKDYNIIGFIGGEFFQGQLRNKKVRNGFFDIIRRINDLLNSGLIREFWITATLIDEIQDGLYEMIDMIDKKDCIWICTSYDTKGRFHTDKMKEQWKTNMRNIKRDYPEVKLNVTTILTGSFIDEYLRGEFNIAEFTREFKCTWFNKPPMLPSECTVSKKEYNEKKLDNFFPTRKRFLEFLTKFRYQESDVEYDKLFNTELRADALIKTDYHNDSNRMVIERNKRTSEEVTKEMKNTEFVSGSGKVIEVFNDTSGKCVHNKAYTPYVDSDACFYCDKEMIKRL